ncbi:MAG: hypothetical protein COX30_02415 [Candidatus Moranbacteria bacterium CG23_combo_of_CG06-09_8_20_14_all_39_10]|nr:MAG: hypothetical protein COX30_02415 [Candidatus Moranbacteria bacterium CG23_combo_of_CG06-09_8_20_14_all_39_10]
MSTVKKNKKSRKGVYKQRFAQLAKMGLLVFHSGDLANLWQIENSNTLHTTLKRYAQEGLIIRIQRGLYSLLPIEKINPELLGIKVLHRFAYVSVETVLVQEGIIAQSIPQITIVSSISKKFAIGKNQYSCRKLADKFLFNDAGIVLRNGIQVATLERAVADLLYFNPKYYFDARQLINWKKVRAIQRQIGYPQT